MKNYNFDNIKKGWKTTVLGVIIALAAVGSVLLKVATWIEASPVLIIGLGLLPYNKEK